MKNKEVCEAFINGYEAKTKNLFCEKSGGKLALYSYGYHFPLCVILKDGTKIFNSLNYSTSTNSHKGILARVCGFDNFKDMVKNGNIELMDTNELKAIIENTEINSKINLIEVKI